MIKIEKRSDYFYYVCEICGADYLSRLEAEKCEKNSELTKPDVSVGDIVHITYINNDNVFRGYTRVSEIFYKQGSHELKIHLHQKIAVIKGGVNPEFMMGLWDGDYGCNLTFVLNWREFVLFRDGDLLKICEELDLPLPRELRISWWQKLKNYFN